MKITRSLKSLISTTSFALLFLAGCSPGMQVESTTGTPLKVPFTQSAATTTPPSNHVHDKTIYGSDSRIDVRQSNDATINELSRSVVALVDSNRLSEKFNGIYYDTSYDLISEYNVCSDEPFADQSVLPFCSGTLIGSDIVLTAGHCVTDQSTCDTTKFVFDYALTSDAQGETPGIISTNNVYGCKSLIHSESDGGDRDFAIIQLDRKVTDRNPIETQKTDGVNVGDSLYMMGYPAGLPLKIDTGATVRTDYANSFLTNVDAFAGNSGSPVMDLNTDIMTGILVRGDSSGNGQDSEGNAAGDYDLVPGSTCNTAHVCTVDGCTGETVIKTSSISDWIDYALSLDAPAAADFPESGWWWNTDHGGTGIALQFNPASGQYLMVDFFYDAQGMPRWAMIGGDGKTGQDNGDGTYSLANVLTKVTGGRIFDLSKPYPTAGPKATGYANGQVSVRFDSATSGFYGNESLWGTWANIPIQRFLFGGSAPAPANVPLTGWYWDPTNGGTGYFIEAQSTSVFLGIMSYDAQGQPFWVISVMNTSKGAGKYANYLGDLVEARGGELLGGGYRERTSISHGNVLLEFSDAQTGVITFANGQRARLTSFLPYLSK